MCWADHLPLSARVFRIVDVAHIGSLNRRMHRYGYRIEFIRSLNEREM